MDYYTNCQTLGKFILHRGIENGQRVNKRIVYEPTLFVKTDRPTEYKTIAGEPVGKLKLGDIKEAKEFISQYEDTENFQVYGLQDFKYAFISDTNQDEIDFSIDDLVIAIIDIETGSKNGFPEPSKALEPIYSIALKIRHAGIQKNHIFYTKNYHGTTNYIKHKCADEQTLLREFLAVWWSFGTPDIISGWNVAGFDVPYLVNRITFVLGQEEAEKLSTWKFIREKEVAYKGHKGHEYELSGVSVLDYMRVYRKFTPGAAKESYSLDYISYLELGKKKLEYEERNLEELYENDFDTFLDYNIRDVELVDEIDQKMKFFDLILGLAYSAKVNYNDVFSQVKMWDILIYNRLKKSKIVIPPKKDFGHRDQYEGAYVKQPVTGMHKWVVSYDVNAMYPHLMAQYNMSPDTIVDRKDAIVPSDLLDQKYDTKYLLDENLTMAANGQHFLLTKQGFLPEILMEMYAERKKFKKLERDCKNELQKIESEMIARGLTTQIN